MILTFIVKYKNFLRYCIIGVSGVLLDFVIFYVLSTKLGVHHQIANIISISCGITNNFLLNAFLNFKTKDRLFIRFLIFYSVGLAGMLISSLMLYIFVDKMAMDVILIKAFTLIVVTIIQYTLNKTFSFRRL